MRKLVKKDIIKVYFYLHILFFLYSWVLILLNFASEHPFLSFNFIILFSSALMILAFYALIWQKVIKKTDISIAYPQKSIVILWVMLWSWLIWRENVTTGNIAGAFFVLCGIVFMVKSDE